MELGLIYDRSSQLTTSGADSRWLAYHADPNQRHEVRWIHKLPSGQIVDGWYSIDGLKKWNSLLKIWE